MASSADIGLSDLRAFVAVAQNRSFRGAADALGVSRSALSHSLRVLEQRLGVRLLHRTTRSVAPTESGAELLRRLAPMLRELGDVLEAVSHGPEELVGTLRINANEGGARWLLRHAVPVFHQRHPRIMLDLVTEGRLIDIVAEGFDAGVRLMEAVPQDMVAVPFGGATRFVAVASPGYVAQHGSPAVPEDLKRHRCIRQRLPSGKLYRWEFSKAGQEIAIDVPGALSLDNSRLMVEAAVAGLGIAFVPQPFVQEALANGDLQMLLDDWSPPIQGLCLYYAGHRNVPEQLKSFIAIVREQQAAANGRQA